MQLCWWLPWLFLNDSSFMKLFAKWVWIIVTNYTSLKIKKEITS
jgi:hypothetical protein